MAIKRVKGFLYVGKGFLVICLCSDFLFPVVLNGTWSYNTCIESLMAKQSDEVPILCQYQ